jgi:rare lipoprotein A
VAGVYGGLDGHCGTPTTNGEHVDFTVLTATHHTLPFDTQVRVFHPGSLIVRINDRGPFVRGRDLDLSPAAARAIGLADLGSVTMALKR